MIRIWLSHHRTPGYAYWVHNHDDWAVHHALN